MIISEALTIPVVINKCKEPLWLGSNLPLEASQVELKPKTEVTLTADVKSARVWARSSCSEEQILPDCWKDLNVDPMCGAGTFYYCQDDATDAPGTCREHAKGPIPKESCLRQCDRYDVSVEDGFNVNMTPRMDPWWDCQSEFVDLDHASGQSFCWSIKTALTSPEVLHRYSFMEKWTAPGTNPAAARCLVEGHEHWCHNLFTCTDEAKCDCSSQEALNSRADGTNGELCCSPRLGAYENSKLWPQGPPFAQMCNLRNWPTSPLDKATYIAKYQKVPDFCRFGRTSHDTDLIRSAAEDAKTWHFQEDAVKSCKAELKSDYTVTFCGNALEELLGPMRQVMGGPKFIATLQQVMEKLPDKYTLRDLRLSRNLALGLPVSSNSLRLPWVLNAARRTGRALRALAGWAALHGGRELEDALRLRERLAMMDADLRQQFKCHEEFLVRSKEEQVLELDDCEELDEDSEVSSPVGTPCSEEISTAPPEEGGESHLWEKKEANITPERFLLQRLSETPLRSRVERRFHGQSAKRLGLEVEGGKPEIISAVMREIRRQHRVTRQKARNAAEAARGFQAPKSSEVRPPPSTPAYACAKLGRVRRECLAA
eukprot:g18976.t1